MKKKWLMNSRNPGIVKKAMRIMRITIVLILGIVLTAHAESYSQATKLDVKLENRSVRDVMKFIEENSEYVFLYKTEDVDVNKKVDVNLQDATIQEILDEVLEGENVQYDVFDRQILIRKVPEQIRQQQQQPGRKNITGVVSDKDGLGLPGVSVIVTGTSTGTVTNEDGEFNLSIPADAETLQFSFVGMKTQELPIAGKTVFTVTMNEDIVGMEEVVVVGYGTEKKRDLTGAISTISGETINKIPATNFLQNLQGQTTGLQVSNSGGQAGASSRIRIRGINSISSSTDPLWVIDGLIMSSGDFETLNPADIQSVEVLKDAAATAIYGSRGSNGVIIVTTKRGTTSETRTNISVVTGVTDLTRKPEDIGYLNTAEFFDMMDRARANTGDYEPFDPNKDVIQTNYLLYPDVTGLSRSQALATNTNWYDEVMRMGNATDINASSSAQKENMNFYVSLNYRNETGVVKANDFERLSGLMNLNFNVTKNFNVETKVNLSYTTNNLAPNNPVALGRGTESTTTGGFAGMVEGGLPWLPVYNEDGSYWNPTTPNLAMLSDPLYRRSQQDRYRALMGIALEYAIPGVKGLKLRGTASSDITYSHYIGYMHQALNTRGVSVANDNAYFTKDLVSNVYALFNRNFDKHSLNISTGVETQRITGFTSEVAGEEIIGQYQQVGIPNNITDFFVGARPNNEHNLIGYFGRASYNYDSRYLVSLSMRRDGSSRFSKENRWELFPAVGLGWVPTSESFWNVSFVDFLKLRGSYGKTGNQNIPLVNVDSYSMTLANRYGDNVSGGTRLSVVGSDVTWEVTNALDLGADFMMFDNRLSGTIGYYKQDISRLLLAVPIPNSAGYSRLWSNIGDMTNQGLEFNLNSVNVQTDNFRWETSFNITTNKNEITKLSPDLDNEGKGIVVGRNITRTGSELGMFYLTEYAGVNPDNGVEMVYEIDQDVYKETGKTMIVMVNGEPRKIPANPANISNNRFIQEGKSGLPSFFGGLENTVTYKNFDLNFLIYFQGGNYILDYAEMAQSYPILRNIRRDAVVNSWTPENRNAQWPELRYEFVFDSYDNDWNLIEGETATYYQPLTTKFLYKGDYMRLKNLQLGYTLPGRISEKLNIESARIYLQGTNLFTVTGYKGYDPDITGTSSGGSQGVNLTQGYVPQNLDVPSIKTYSIGVNVQF